MMRWFAGLVALFAVAVIVGRAEAAPKLPPEGCAVAADMVLVARALAAQGVERQHAEKIMALVYANYTHQDAVALRQELADFAYRVKEAPLAVAEMVGRACLANRGDLSPILGVGT